MTNSFAEWPMRGHEVSILMALIGAVDWRCGIAPRSKTSMMIMRPPQHGHGGLPLSTMVSVGSSSRSLTASSSRARAVAEDIRNLQSRTRHAGLASAGRPGLLQLDRDVLQRAHDLADRLGGDAGIERGGIELGVTEQNLDHAHVDVLLQEMSGEAVPQGVQRDPLVDLRHLGSGVAGAVELARGHRLGRIAAREEPALWPCRLPPGAQQIEQVWGEHDVTVLAALALFDPDDHPLAVDVGDLERDDLVGPQAGAIGYAERRLVLEPRCRIEQARHFFRAQHHRQLARLVNDVGVLDDLVALERNLEEEPQRRDGLVDSRHANAVRCQMQLVAPHVLKTRRFRRSPEEYREVLDPLHIVMLGLRRELADRHVFDHAPPQRARGLVGHGDAPVLGEGCEPLISRQDASLRYPLSRAAGRRAYRASGLVL